MNIYFPHETQRPIQEELIRDVLAQLDSKSHLIAHAPTGLGKTAATLSPALTYTLKNNLKIFFLTSRHTQHHIAIETLKKIKKKFKLDFVATSIVGKRSMCLQPGIDRLSSSEFSDYCKKLREEGICEYYVKTKKNDGRKTVLAKKVLKDLKSSSPNNAEEIIEICHKNKLCPYELAAFLSKEATVIVCDYYYVFNPIISENFFSKAEVDIEKTIVIIDEGHNLPSRMRELMSNNLSDYLIDLAIKEADKYKVSPTLLIELEGVLNKITQGLTKERLVSKDTFYKEVDKIKDYFTLTMELEQNADLVRENRKKSFIGSVSKFLTSWSGADEGYIRFIQKEYTAKGPVNTLYYKCLDPSIITAKIISKCHSAILMSGTLTPTFMYKDLLKFPANTLEKEYQSPFPNKNRLTLIVPKTTTKYSLRSEDQYKKIADELSKITKNVPGNTAVFFPSYALRDSVRKYFETQTNKTVFCEMPRMTKSDKEEFLERFKSYKNSGAVLLAVTSGSFGEGVDLPGDLLKAVVIVGLPLGMPNLETKELINYYNKNYGRGWDYGYVLPAITRTLQNAGRCIRTETDRGLIVFLDERYSWPMYFKCFPADWNLKIKTDPEKIIQEFFTQSN